MMLVVDILMLFRHNSSYLSLSLTDLFKPLRHSLYLHKNIVMLLKHFKKLS